MNGERLKQIVSDALDLPPGDRDAYVRKLCAGDAEAVDQVLSLLHAAGGSDAHTRLDSAPQFDDVAGVTVGPDSTLMPPGPGVAAPDKFGRYKVLECIGEGGMGIVYRAEQRSPIRREVVVKVIKLGMDTKLVIARFEAERQALAMMDHPHIAKVYDAGADSLGRPYFAMEYVKGTAITDYCDRNHLSIDDRLLLFEQVCHAIQHAHHKGIIHRDIKPGNVLVSTQDGKPYAKVIDFGIAKATNQRLTDRTLFTEHVNMIGTPAYMSPEQADGNIDIDTRTDVYSLGVLLYEMLTGYTPFDPKRLRGAALNEMARIIREEDPPKPSTRVSTLKAFRPPASAQQTTVASQPAAPVSSATVVQTLAKDRGISEDAYLKSLRGEIDWMVMKAIEKDRARRYETPSEFADDIRRFLDGAAINAAPPGWGYQTRKFARKYKAPLAAGLAVTVLLVLGLAGTAVGLVRARQALVREREATAREIVSKNTAELEAYIANLGAAQTAMAGESWPEARNRLESCPEKSRGWEWKYLRRIADTPKFGFVEPVTNFLLSTNDRLLLTGYLRDWRVIDLLTQRQLGTYHFKLNNYSGPNGFGGTREPVAAIAPDGCVAALSENQLVVFGPDGAERLGIPLGVVDGAEQEVEFSNTGAYVSVRQGGTRVFIDRYTGRICLKVGILDQVACAISKSDRQVLVSDNTKILVYELATGKQKLVLRHGNYHSNCVAVSPDETTAAIGSDHGEVAAFSLVTGQQLRKFETGSRDPMHELQYSPDGKYLVASQNNTSVKVFDAASSKLLQTLQRPCTGSPHFSSDSKFVVFFGNDFIWDWQKGSADGAVTQPAQFGSSLIFTSDAKLAISGTEYRLRVWDTSKSQQWDTISNLDSEPRANGIRCATFGKRDLYVHEWGPSFSDVVLANLNGRPNESPADGTAGSSDGHWTAAIAPGHGLTVRDNTSARPVVSLIGHEGPVRSLVFSPDNTRLVTGGDDCTVRFWDTTSWRNVATIQCYTPVVSLAFAGDGSRLVEITGDRAIQSQDVRSPAQVAQDKLDRARRKTGCRQAVTAMLDGPAPWESLAQVILEDPKQTPSDKVAELEEMHDQLLAVDRSASATFHQIAARQLTRPRIEKAIAGGDSPRSTRKALEHQLAVWRPSQQVMLQNARAVVDQKDRSAEDYAAALQIAEDAARDVVDDHAKLQTLALARYRCGNYDGAIEVLNKAMAIGAGKTRRVNRDTPTIRPSRHEINIDQTILAMAESRSGKAAAAKADFRELISQWGKIGDRNLQIEAAMMIDPASTRPAHRPESPGLARITDAIDAQDLTALAHAADQTVKLKGSIENIEATATGSSLNILLAPQEAGVIIFVPGAMLARLPQGYFTQAEGCDVVIEGVLTQYGGRRITWKGRPQITLDDPKNMTVFFAHPKPSEAPAGTP